jgi:hypothetical protein
MAEGIVRTACLEGTSETGLAGEIRLVLQISDAPLTVAKIRAARPGPLRSVPREALAEILQRQVAANVLVRFPPYRSRQERFWDRPMDVHLDRLLRHALRRGPATWSEIRKRLPAYARRLAEPVLENEVAQGRLFCHPPATSRTGTRYGLEPPDPRPYLQVEFAALLSRCEQQGLARPLVRAALLHMLRDEEWAPSGVCAQARHYASSYRYQPADKGDKAFVPRKLSAALTRG